MSSLTVSVEHSCRMPRDTFFNLGWFAASQARPCRTKFLIPKHNQDWLTGYFAFIAEREDAA